MDSRKLEYNEIYAPLTKEILMKNLYWTINKFNEDPHHKQQNSSRDDLIGGFLDRWINRIPEFLIFKEFLKSEGYTPVVDNFIYTEKSSKNAPDIIGLKDNDGNYFKFAEFNNNRWEFNKEAPFIEMKVFRSTQNLITIPETQFQPWKYYAIVESDVPDNYLISVFEKTFFENPDFYNEINDVEIKEKFARGKFGLYSPKKLEPLSHLGGFKLLGIYKGSILEYYGKHVSMEKDKPVNPIYLKKEPELYTFTNSEKICEGVYKDYFYDTCAIPFFIKTSESSRIKLINSSDLCITINVEGSVLLNNKECPEGDYNLCFSPIFRNGVKYYFLEKISRIENPIIEKDLILGSGFFMYYDEKHFFVECAINHDDDSSLDVVVITKSYIIFKISGNVKINEIDYCTGLYKFEFISHNHEKSKDGIIYRMLQKGEKKDNLNRIKKINRCLVSFPNGQYDFDSELLDNPEFDYSNICFEVLNSNSEIIGKTSKNFIIAVNGSVSGENINLKKGLHKVNFGLKNKKFFIKNIDENIDNPLLNKDALNLNKFLNFENNSYGIIDLKYINNIKNTNNLNNTNSQDNENENMFIPFSVKLIENSTIKIHEKSNSKIIVSIDGTAKINNYKIDDSSNNILSKNYYKLEFEKFARSSKKGEFILSKKALESSNLSSEVELIGHIKNFTKKFKDVS